MQLIATGKIVRAEGCRVAIQTVQHEFRTAGHPVERNTGPAGNTRNPAVVPGAAMSAGYGTRKTVASPAVP
jgi:hypothetical protein